MIQKDVLDKKFTSGFTIIRTIKERQDMMLPGTEDEKN